MRGRMTSRNTPVATPFTPTLSPQNKLGEGEARIPAPEPKRNGRNTVPSG